MTSLWKGKGDREALENHRGITVSSTIGNILEEIIDRRIQGNVKFTQAQRGGLKGASTCDHIFILQSMINIALKQKRKTYITFFDVQKAYDHVDNRDMLGVMWDAGLKGKVWRILKELCSGLTASIKTRHGTTREIQMEIGGKQGSKVTGRMFSKLMDILSEEIIERKMGFEMANQFIIGALMWVDDVVSCVDGIDNQTEMLQIINNFAKNHKLQWGAHKCKVMAIGKHNKQNKWPLGDLEIENCNEYKYLGDIISNDGKNKQNINERKRKATATTISINTLASNEILNCIETPILLELHERITIPTLLNNAEAWVLKAYEIKELEQIERNCIKSLFNLPTRTPTPAIIYTLGLLYTNIRIEKKQLIYLHRILNRKEDHWTKKTLNTLKELKTGWYNNMIKILNSYELNSDFDAIKNIPTAIWKHTVTTATETMNKKRLLDDCYKKENGEKIPKSKTKSIIDKLNAPDYTRKPINEIMSLPKYEGRTVILSRYGMLECGKNFKGTLRERCLICDLPDDEEHRLNKCPKYDMTNFSHSNDIVPFESIFSGDTKILKTIVPHINQVWNLKNGHGSML